MGYFPDIESEIKNFFIKIKDTKSATDFFIENILDLENIFLQNKNKQINQNESETIVRFLQFYKNYVTGLSLCKQKIYKKAIEYLNKAYYLKANIYAGKLLEEKILECTQRQKWLTAYSTKDFKQCLNLISVNIKNAKNDSQKINVIRDLITTYLTIGKYKDALKFSNKIASMKEATIDDEIVIPYILLQRNNNIKALDYSEEIIKKYSNIINADLTLLYIIAGIASYNIGAETKSLAFFKTASELNLTPEAKIIVNKYIEYLSSDSRLTQSTIRGIEKTIIDQISEQHEQIDLKKKFMHSFTNSRIREVDENLEYSTLQTKLHEVNEPQHEYDDFNISDDDVDILGEE